MGGEETEIGEATTTVLLEAANFEPLRHLPQLRAPPAPHGGLEPLGEGRRPVPRRAGRRPRDQAPARAGRRHLDGARATCRASCRSARSIAFRPERADALIGIETPPERQYAILARLGFDRRDGEVVAPTWRARDVTREIDVIEEIARFRLEDVPFTLPARREMNGRSPASSSSGAGSRTRSSASASPRPTRRACAPTTTRPGSCPSRSRSSSTALTDDAAPEPRRGAHAATSTPAPRGIALFEIARVYLPAGDELARGAAPGRRDRRGRLPARQGRRRDALRALKAEPHFEPGEPPLLHPGKAARTRAGSSASSIPRELDGEWGAFELDLGRASSPLRTSPSPTAT